MSAGEIYLGLCLLLVIGPVLRSAAHDFGWGKRWGRNPQSLKAYSSRVDLNRVSSSRRPDSTSAPVAFGKRTAFEEPQRPSSPLAGQIFDRELFEGERGEFLRKFSYFPDDPRNQAANAAPLAALLAEDAAAMRRVKEHVNKAGSLRVVPLHLLPPSLWRSSFGPWLRQELDLSPYRPWNTIFLPADEASAEELGLPVASKPTETVRDATISLLAIIRDTYAGKDAPEGKAVAMAMAAVRSDFAQLFPRDTADFSPRVQQARADVRALAFSGGTIERELIVKTQARTLGRPEIQLLA